jgi:hypothetical protein
MFMSGTTVSSAYIVEVLSGRTWLPFGENKGIKKFATREEAETEAKQLSKLAPATP